MSKKLKIIIAIILALILALGIYIAPRVIPYTPPTPNIIKTDQGSFELRMAENKNFEFTLEFYREYESHAKDYYSRILPIFKTPNLIVNSNVYIVNEGHATSSITFTLDNDKNNHFFEAKYIYDNKRNFIEDRFKYRGFFNYSSENSPQLHTLEELIQQPEYQNLKL